MPALVRWPGKIKANSVSNEIISHQDWLPTLMAAAGDRNIKKKLLKGHSVSGKKFKVHLDGFNFLPYISGKTKEGPRKEFFYFTDDGNYSAMRMGDWKLVFSEQRAHGFQVWREPLTRMRLPKIFNLRRDPFERADREAMDYDRWATEHLFMLYAAQAGTARFLQSFKQFPPRQRPASFNVEKIVESMLRWER